MDSHRQIIFLTRETLQTAKADLLKKAETKNPNAALPEKLSRPHIIRALRAEIAAMFRQGYVVEDIIGVLADNGIPMDPRTFREYWRVTKRRGPHKAHTPQG